LNLRILNLSHEKAWIGVDSLCFNGYNIFGMVSFKIGDSIVYPNQGLGIVEDIQKEKYYGEEFVIYHVRILTNNTLVLVPLSNAEEIGIRKLIPLKSIEKIYKFMGNGGVEVTMNWKGRYKEHVNLMKSGSVLDMALVLKSLFYLNLIKPLSFREKKMMEKAKELLISEISEVNDCPSVDVEKKILDKLSKCFKDTVCRVES
jgi:CarD family transcriptional regulator